MIFLRYNNHFSHAIRKITLVMGEPWCSSVQCYNYIIEKEEIPIFTLCLSKKDWFIFNGIYIFIYQSAYCNLHSISQLDNLTWPSHFIVVALIYRISHPEKVNKYTTQLEFFWNTTEIRRSVKRQHPKIAYTLCLLLSCFLFLVQK